MKLANVQITEFRSITDTNQFSVGDITCLVGKNEAGKTAILHALYKLNPIDSSDGEFDVTHDYPRNHVEDYRFDVEAEKRDAAIVTKAEFVLLDEDVSELFHDFGEDSLTDRQVVIKKGYGNSSDGYNFTISVDEPAVLKHLIQTTELSREGLKKLANVTTAEGALEILTSFEETSEIADLKKILDQVKKQGIRKYVWDTYLTDKLPKFLYFDEYYQMTGRENIQALTERQNNKNLLQSDHPLLGLIELARLKLNDLQNPDDTQELKNKLQGASNYLSNQVLKYWSQNKHIQMLFDVRPGLSKDPEGMRSGMNIWAEVFDSRHRVSTNLGTRSRGFVWFFSFLAWYSQIKRTNQQLIILLDEPGLSLHGKAQEDLLKYFEAEIAGVHQLIYTTHSPFMVDPRRFERVRIVQDKAIDASEPVLPHEEGTRVLENIEDASEDSLFPLQGALGYEIHQTLFVGPNSLVVEGTSDLVYLQVISSLLEDVKREPLSSKWTITPVGGSDKVPTFVALLGSQKGLNLATLIDIQKRDVQKIENLYKKKLLKKSHVLTFADFTQTAEADIENMFDRTFYIGLVNAAYKSDLAKKITESSLNSKIPRVTSQLEEYFASNPLKNNLSFNHFRPARYLADNLEKLKASISSDTLDRFEEAFRALNKLL